MHAIRLSIVALLSVLVVTASIAQEERALEDSLENVVRIASDYAYDAGWCSAMISLAGEIKKDKRLAPLLSDYLKTELKAKSIDSKELANFCLQAIGRSKLFTTKLADLLVEQKAKQDSDAD